MKRLVVSHSLPGTIYCSLTGPEGVRADTMAAPRRVIEIAIGDKDLGRPEAIVRSQTQPTCRVERARILLAYRADPSAYAVGRPSV